MGIPVRLRMPRDPLPCEKPLLCMQEGSFDARFLVSDDECKHRQRGLWNASQETLDELRSLYLSIEGDLEERAEGSI